MKAPKGAVSPYLRFLALLLGLFLLLPSWAEENSMVPDAEQPIHEAAAQADRPSNLVLILSIDSARDELKDAQRQFFLEALLYDRVNKAGSIQAYLLEAGAKRPKAEVLSGVPGADDIKNALDTLAKLSGNLLRNLHDELGSLFKEILTNHGADSAPLDIWMIEQRSPISAPSGILKSSLEELVKSPAPAICFHFLYLGDARGEGLEVTVRQIIQEQADTGNVQDRTVDAYRLDSQGWPDEIHTLLSKVSDRTLQQEINQFEYNSEARVWRTVFRMPGGTAREEPLIYIRHPEAAGPIVPETVSLKDATGALLPYQLITCRQASLLLLRQGSDQELTLSFAFQTHPQDDQSLSPGGIVRREVPTGKKVWLESGPEQAEWKREPNQIQVCSDADYRPLDAWIASLTVDGQEVQAQMTTKPTDESGQFVWEFEVPVLEPGERMLRALLKDQEGKVILLSQPLPIAVINQEPAVQKNQEEPCVVLFDDVSAEQEQTADGATEGTAFSVDLSACFTDHDGDPLRFVFAINDEENDTIQNELYHAEIAGNSLSIQPRREPETGSLELRIIAMDTYGGKSEALTLRFEPRSLKKLLNSWTLTGEERLNLRAGQRIDHEMVYQGDKASRDLALYLDNRERLGLLPLEEALQVPPLTISANGASNTVKTTFSVKQTDGSYSLHARIQSEALQVDTAQTLCFEPRYHNLLLEGLLPDLQANIQNQPPAITLDKTHSLEIKGEVEGSPGQYETIALSQLIAFPLNLEDLFHDEETPQELSYHLRVKGLPHEVVLDGQLVYPEQERQTEPAADAVSSQPEKEDGSKAAESAIPDTALKLPQEAEYRFDHTGKFDITFHDVGQAEVRLYARDATTSSEELVIKARVGSRRQRIMLTIGGIVVGAGILLVMLLVIRQRRKPSFQGKEAAIKSGFINREGQEYTTTASLGAFHKETIPLSTLLIAARQPLPRSMDINDFTDSVVQLKGRDEYLIVLGKRSRDVLNVSETKKTKDLGKPVVLTSWNGYRLEICIRQKDDDDPIDFM